MTEQNEQQKPRTKKNNYPAHIVRRKETKPRKPGGGRKPTGQTQLQLRVTVSKVWHLKAKAKADSMGIALDRFCRELLYDSSKFRFPDDFQDET